MVKETMADAMFDEEGGGKYLRLFNIMKADPKNYDLISKGLNKMLTIGTPAAIGAATITSQPKKQKGGGYFNPTLDPAFLQNTVQNFNQQEAKLTPQQKAELEKQRKLEYLKAHPEKYNVGYYQQYKKSEPGLEESVSPLDFLGPAEIKAVGKLASKAVGKLARVGEKVLPKVAAKSAKEIEAAADLAKFREKFAKYQKEGLSPVQQSMSDAIDNGVPDYDLNAMKALLEHGKQPLEKSIFKSVTGATPNNSLAKGAVNQSKYSGNPFFNIDPADYPEGLGPNAWKDMGQEFKRYGYENYTGIDAFQELTANSFPNPLAIADRIIPRTPTPLQYLGAEDSWNNYSPLNWIPGYGKKLSRDAELYHPSIKYNGKPALLDDIQGDLQPVGFRKFGNSLEDVIKRKVLGPKGGNRMGADQIVKEGNWAEPSKVNEHYSGLFEATMNPNVKGSNIKLEPWRNRRGIVGTTKEGNVDIPLTDPGLSFNRRLPFSNKYVSIDKQKLLDNEFQLATQLPHVQSLIEKYGIVAGQAAVFGYLAGGKEQAIKNLKTINKYSVDPVVNWTKKQWEDMNSSDFLKEHKELTKEKQGGSSGYTKGMKPANGKLFSNIVKQAKSRFKVLNTPTVKAWIDAQYHNAGGNYHYDYNTRQFGGDNNEINTIMKNNNLSKFTGHYQVGGAQQQIPLTPEQQYKKDHPDYGNDDLINQFDYSAKYIDSEGRVTIPRKKTNNSGFNQGTQQNFNNQKQDTSYMQEGDRYFQLYGDKKMPISNVSYMQAQKRLGLTPGLTPPTQYNRAFGGAPTANEFFDFGQQPPSFAFYQAGGAPTAEEFFNFGMQPPSFAFYGHGGESDCPECDAMMLDENVNEMKSGGNWIQGAVKHPGRCTPGSPNYDCPKGSPQWNLAQTFKKHHGFQKKQDGGGTDGNFNNINDAPQYAQDTFLNALKTQTQQALAKQEYENMEQMHQAFMQMGGNIPAQSLQWRDRSQDSPIQNMNELINPIVNRFDNDGQPNFGDNAYSESGVPTELTQRSNADKLLQSQYNAQQNAIAKAKAMGLGQFVYKQMGGNSLPKAQYGPPNYDPNAPMQNSYEVTPEMQWQSTANQIAFQPDNSEQQYEGDNPLGLDLSSQAYQPKRQDIGDDSPEEQLRFNGINGEVAANYEMAGINKLSEYLERKQRKPYEDKLKQRQNADAVFTPVGANMNSRGDYDVNSGMFRPDQMVPIQNRGYAKFGGGYQSGGEYFLDDNEIQQILDAGGQVEYLED
jgi:hypothetical protein